MQHQPLDLDQSRMRYARSIKPSCSVTRTLPLPLPVASLPLPCRSNDQGPRFSQRTASSPPSLAQVVCTQAGMRDGPRSGSAKAPPHHYGKRARQRHRQARLELDVRSDRVHPFAVPPFALSVAQGESHSGAAQCATLTQSGAGAGERAPRQVPQHLCVWMCAAVSNQAPSGQPRHLGKYEAKNQTLSPIKIGQKISANRYAQGQGRTSGRDGRAARLSR